jgi:hypothetical protein
MTRGLLAVALLGLGCGGDDGDGANNDDGCLPGSYDVDGDWPFDDGPYAIAGTVTLPASVPSGHFVQLETIKIDPFPGGNYLKPAMLSASKSMIAFRSSGLTDGTWKICLRVDVDGNQMTGGAGTDYIGCFDGTTAAPIRTSSDAPEIVLSGACQSGKDFGVGVQ